MKVSVKIEEWILPFLRICRSVVDICKEPLSLGLFDHRYHYTSFQCCKLHELEDRRERQRDEVQPRESDDGEQDVALLSWAGKETRRPVVCCNCGADEPHDPDDGVACALEVERGIAFSGTELA